MVNTKELIRIIGNDHYCRLQYNVYLDLIYYADIDLRYEGCCRTLYDGWYDIDVVNEFEETIETFELQDNKIIKWYYSEFLCTHCLLSRSEQRKEFLSHFGVNENTKYFASGVIRLKEENIKKLMLKEIDTIEKFFTRQNQKECLDEIQSI